MDDERLIELVRRYPPLYDLSNPKYMYTDFKNYIWSHIGTELDTTGPACKRRWSNIRDNYRKSLRKNKTVNGQTAKTVKMYKYSEQLSFLAKFMEELETTTNINYEITDEDLTGDSDASESVSVDEEISWGIKTEDNPETVEPQRRPSSNINKKKSAEYTAPRKKVKQSVPPTKTAAPLMEYYTVTKNDTMGSSLPPPQHEVDAFLSGIAPTLKTLPPQFWHFAKSEIFAAVQKYELKSHLDQQEFPESSLVSTSTPT